MVELRISKRNHQLASYELEGPTFQRKGGLFLIVFDIKKELGTFGGAE